MPCDKCKNKPMVTQYLGDIQIDALDSLPDFILAERDVEDPLSGDIIRSLVRVPAGKLFPNGNYDNVSAIVANNDELDIPDRQVRAGYVKNNVSSTQVLYADAENPAMFLMIGELTDMVLIQPTGVINMLAGHDYIIGAQYYAGEAGVPTTDDASGQKLFIPISRTQLLINL